MSVIDFIAVRRRQSDTRSEPTVSAEKSRATPAALTASQFTRHIAHIIEDEMRRSLKRHVEVIDPREMIDLAKLVAELKAKYIGTTLAIASNRQPITDSELEQLRNYRVKIQELEAAHNELNEAIASQLVEVRGVVKGNSHTDQVAKFHEVTTAPGAGQNGPARGFYLYWRLTADKLRLPKWRLP